MSALFEKTLTTDRWPNRAVSPLPFDANTEGLEVVIVHPGWGKRPEIHTPLLEELTEAGFRAIGLDTRYGYADQGLDATARLMQRAKTGRCNPFFDDTSSVQNRYFYRRPTALLQACVDLEIEACHLVGHSEGGRIGLVAANADQSPVLIKRMVTVNGVGTGSASGVAGMLQANLQALQARNETGATTREALHSFRDSVVHFATHPRRTQREAEVIAGYDAWADIGHLSLKLDQMTVMNARDDRLINFGDADMRSLEYPEVRFIPTDGSHSNVYEPAVREQIISELAI